MKVKKAKKFNANGATLKWLEALGWTAEVVEHRIPTTFITRDFLGCIDIIAIRAPSLTLVGGIVGVQATSGGGNKGQSNGLARHRKLLASEKAKMFVAAGAGLWLVVWTPPNPLPEVTVIALADFVGAS